MEVGDKFYSAYPFNDGYLSHIGTETSGRYPKGSGENPYQHDGNLRSRIKELQSKNFSIVEDGVTYRGELAIAKALGYKTTTALRNAKALESAQERSERVARVEKLYSEGMNPTQIAREMGFKSESSVRSLLNKDSKRRMKLAESTADYLQSKVDKIGMIDIGGGTQYALGVSREKMREAVKILEDRGYEVWGGKQAQVTNPGQFTNMKILCPPGTPHKAIYELGKIHTLGDEISYDGGTTFKKAFRFPQSLDSKRLAIVYDEDGGSQRDGMIEIRRGVKDLSLGKSNYSQVRILVDGTHYLKGMATYSDDLPDGIDVRFNTNKHKGTPALGDDKNHTVLKKIKSDPNNPFGSALKEHGGQSDYLGDDGQMHMSLINKTREEGDWETWSKALPAQFLAKQPMKLINRQLKLTVADKQAEFDEIMSITNPAVKQSMLKSFSDDCDAAAVHLQAAALPRQRYQVILPVPSLKNNEVYAPNYANGEHVALVRFPHGGVFEIPELIVNNKNSEGQRVIGKQPIDAIGINKETANQLSGADWDGDTVLVIPTGGDVKIHSEKPLEGLKDFDPKMKYGGKEPGTFKPMQNTQNEMGKISNLITDMTLKGASPAELAAAVRHSMVVIDAEKHALDYKQSEIDNNIAYLKKKYQGYYREDGTWKKGGASTLISRAKSEVSVPRRKGTPHIDPKTGEYVYREDPDRFYTTTEVDKRTGKKVEVPHERMTKSTQMFEAKDAMTLSSGRPEENAYADYANKMKAMGNLARKSMIETPNMHKNGVASRVYAPQVKELEDALVRAGVNAPRERQAQRLAGTIVKARKQENPGLTKEEIKKISNQALIDARLRTGAKGQKIKITAKQWEAIQAGAISHTKLKEILKYCDMDVIRDYATPRNAKGLTSGQEARIRNAVRNGDSLKDIAEAFHVSLKTVQEIAPKGAM